MKDIIPIKSLTIAYFLKAYGYYPIHIKEESETSCIFFYEATEEIMDVLMGFVREEKLFNEYNKGKSKKNTSE